MNKKEKSLDFATENIDFVTFTVSDQLFGVPVIAIHDVFTPRGLAPVPLASENIAGVLNLRGRIVTAIDARRILGLPSAENPEDCMAIGIDKDGESYGIIIDRVGEVLSLSSEQYEPSPVNLDSRWRDVSRGVYRLDDALLIVLDIDGLLQINQAEAA